MNDHNWIAIASTDIITRIRATTGAGTPTSAKSMGRGEPIRAQGHELEASDSNCTEDPHRTDRTCEKSLEAKVNSDVDQTLEQSGVSDYEKKRNDNCHVKRKC